jgi:hypothetical protein
MIAIGQIRKGSGDSIRIDQGPRNGMWRCIYKSRSRMDAQDDSEWLGYDAIEKDYPTVLVGREAELEEESFHEDEEVPAATPDPILVVRKGTPPIDFIEINLNCGQDAGIYVERAENEDGLFVIRCFGKGRETFNKKQLRGLAEALLELARES